MNEIEVFPRLVLRLNAEESEEHIIYSFVCMSYFTPGDFTVHGGIREELDEAVAELASIAPQAFQHMKEDGYAPTAVMVMLAKELPDLPGIYQKLTFGIDSEGYECDSTMMVKPTCLN